MPLRGLVAVCLAAFGVATGLVACQSPPTPHDHLVVPPDRYSEAFDAAVAAARDIGLPPAVRDRSAGLIETQAKVAGSLFEPWLFGEESLDQAAENTILFQRRRARIEFTIPSKPLPGIRDASEPLPGATLPGRASLDPLDVTAADEPLEVRVKVFVERAFVPGLKPSSYSRTLNTKYTDPLRPERETWTPVGRDAAWEARILADLGKRMSLTPVVDADPGRASPAADDDGPQGDVMPLEERSGSTAESAEATSSS
ncbi:MAG: hypothetical protein ACO3NL_02575 [Phycisphaerales bacterium]|jgi:hypothetical protein